MWYHEGLPELLAARYWIAEYSIPRAQERLVRAREEVLKPGAEKAAKKQELHKKLRVRECVCGGGRGVPMLGRGMCMWVEGEGCTCVGEGCTCVGEGYAIVHVCVGCMFMCSCVRKWMLVCTVSVDGLYVWCVCLHFLFLCAANHQHMQSGWGRQAHLLLPVLSRF